MRLTIKLLNQDSTLNNFAFDKTLDISRGETAEVIFQLVQENGQRYIPTSDATVEVSIARNPTAIGVTGGGRAMEDNSIKRQATEHFTADRSIWSIPLTTAETMKMISGAIKVTVTEGAKVKMCQLNQAIRIIDGQEK